MSRRKKVAIVLGAFGAAALVLALATSLPGYNDATDRLERMIKDAEVASAKEEPRRLQRATEGIRYAKEDQSDKRNGLILFGGGGAFLIFLAAGAALRKT